MQVSKRLLLSSALGFIAALLLIFCIRFIAFSPENTHYHANFALFIDGEREQFDNFSFYEEVSSCGTGEQNPARRVHMHDNINNVVHVHDEEVTWVHFFENLRFGLGDKSVTTDDGVFSSDDDNQLSFILNGEKVREISGRIIGDEDVLLVSYGSESDDELQQQYAQIEESAGGYNETADPAACSGDEKATIINRLKHAVSL